MATLRFSFGTMGSGKSTLALQIHHNLSSRGMRGLLCTRLDREGARVSSRLGVSADAVDVGPKLDLHELAATYAEHHGGLSYLVCDEAQFYTPAQVDQLARVVDDLGIDVYCFGILTDFRTRMFPGSARLVELCDRMEILQARPRCWCGQPATHNARTVDGIMVTEGDQVAVGDTQGDGEVAYETLCRAHMRRCQPASVGRVDLTPDPLPFGD